MEGGRSRNEKETGPRTKRGLIGPMYSESLSLHICGPDLEGPLTCATWTDGLFEVARVCGIG